MNSLQELNTFGNTTVTYTDSRPAAVKFDRVTPTTQTISINQHDAHPAQPGFQIIDIIRPTDCLPTYTINVSAITGATVAWTTVPSGCTVTNPTTGVYKISGVSTVAKWLVVSSPVISLPVSYVGVSSYTCTVTWNTTETKTSTTNLTVVDIDIFGADPSDLYFLGGVAGTITGNPVIIDNYSTTWTATVTPSSTSLITSLTSAGTGGTSSFNATTKVLTIAGTKTQVNSHLNSISYVIPSTTKQDFTLEYGVVNDTLSEGDSRTQQLLTTEILSATRANESYITNTSTTISNGPLITDALYTGLASYNMTITPSITGAIDTMSNSTMNYYPEFLNSPTDTTVLFSKRLASTDLLYFAGADWDAGNVRSNNLYVYKRAINSETLLPEIILDATISATNESFLENNTTFDILLSSSQATTPQTFKIRSRSESTWTTNYSIQSAPSNTGAARITKLSSSGDQFFVGLHYNGVGTTGTGYFYRNNAGTWGQDSAITIPDGTLVEMFYSPTGDTFFLHRYESLTVYIYKKVSNVWSQSQTITNASEQYSRLLPNGTVAIYNTSTSQTDIYTDSSGTWTKTSTVAYQYPDRKYRLTTDTNYYSDGDTIYKFNGTSYIHYVYLGNNSTTDPNFANARTEISLDGTYIIRGSSSTSALSYIFLYKKTGSDPNSVSWNNSTKVLTLTGTKTNINAMIDAITLVPATDYAEDFTLTYTVVTPTSTTDSRTQLVTHTS